SRPLVRPSKSTTLLGRGEKAVWAPTKIAARIAKWLGRRDISDDEDLATPPGSLQS
ncbi:uncharacterized protein METZ01_LOCUS260348, partial [marine metagenome]